MTGKKFDDGALVRILVGDIEIVRLRARRRRATCDGGLRIGLTALYPLVVVAHADDLGNLIHLFADVSNNIRLKFDGPGFSGEMWGIGLVISQSLPR